MIDIIANGLKPVKDKVEIIDHFFMQIGRFFASDTKNSKTASRERKN